MLAGKANSSHNHSAGEITSGTLAVARGGTGLTTSPSMLTNLGSTTAASVLAASPRPGVTGTLPIANGGTGATDAATARSNLGVTPANIGAATTATYTVSVPYSGWSAVTGGWSKSVTVSGITASDNPIVDIVMGSDASANENYAAAWSTVQRIVTAANSITIYTTGDPKVAFNIQLKVVR